MDSSFKPTIEALLVDQKKTDLRLPFWDDATKKELLLFIKKGYAFGVMQTWVLQGICELKDYSEEMEKNGSIKKWLEVEIF